MYAANNRTSKYTKQKLTDLNKQKNPQLELEIQYASQQVIEKVHRKSVRREKTQTEVSINWM